MERNLWNKVSKLNQLFAGLRSAFGYKNFKIITKGKAEIPLGLFIKNNNFGDLFVLRKKE